jgi:hypothetical protein
MFKVFALVCYFSFVPKSSSYGTNNGFNRQTFENGVSTSSGINTPTKGQIILSNIVNTLEMPFPKFSCETLHGVLMFITSHENTKVDRT